jgi:hypothetical protein
MNRYRTYIDEPLDVALLEVEEDRCVVEVGQVRHVLATVVLRRVHLNKNKSTCKAVSWKESVLYYQGKETDLDTNISDQDPAKSSKTHRTGSETSPE